MGGRSGSGRRGAGVVDGGGSLPVASIELGGGVVVDGGGVPVDVLGAGGSLLALGRTLALPRAVGGTESASRSHSSRTCGGDVT